MILFLPCWLIVTSSIFDIHFFYFLTGFKGSAGLKITSEPQNTEPQNFEDLKLVTWQLTSDT